MLLKHWAVAGIHTDANCVQRPGGCPIYMYDAGRGDSYIVLWHIPDNYGDLLVTSDRLSSRDWLGCGAPLGMEVITHKISSSISRVSSSMQA